MGLFLVCTTATMPLCSSRSGTITVIHRIEIRAREEFGDRDAAGVCHQIKKLGIDAVESVRLVKLFFLGGGLATEDASHIAAELLAQKLEVVDPPPQPS